MTDDNIYQRPRCWHPRDQICPELERLNTEPDWTPWEDETVNGYMARLISQSLWQAGEYANKTGDEDHGTRLWRLADAVLDYAYPPPPPTEIDLAADQ